MNLATGIDTILHCVEAVGSRTVSPLLVDIGDYLGVHVVRSNHNLATLEHWSPVTQIQRYRLECQTIDVSLWSERDQIPVVRKERGPAIAAVMAGGLTAMVGQTGWSDPKS